MKRAGKVLLLSLILLAASLLTLFGFRRPLAGHLLRSYAAQQNLPLSFEMVDITATHLEIRAIALGAHRLESLRVSYRLQDLLRHRVTDITANGLSLSQDLPTLPVANGRKGSKWQIANITLTDGNFIRQTATTTLSMDFSMQGTLTNGIALSSQFSLAANIAGQPAYLQRGSVALTWQETRKTLLADLGDAGTITLTQTKPDVFQLLAKLSIPLGLILPGLNLPVTANDKGFARANIDTNLIQTAQGWRAESGGKFALAVSDIAVTGVPIHYLGGDFRWQDDKFSGTANLKSGAFAALPPLSLTGKVTANLTNLQIAPQPFDVRLPDKTLLKLTPAPLIFTRTQEGIDLAATQIALVHATKSPLFQPLTTTLSGKYSEGTLSLTGNLGLRDKKGMKLPFTLTHKGDIGNLKFPATPVTLSPKTLQPRDVSHLFPPEIQGVTAALMSEFSFKWHKGNITSSGNIAASALSFIYNDILFEAGTLSLPFSSLLPMVIQDARVDFATIGGEKAFNAARARFNITLDPPILAVSSAETTLFDGTISMPPQSFNLDDSPKHILMNLKGVDLEILSKTLNIKGVSATGKLDGSLPLVLFKNGFSVDTGKMATRDKGILMITSAQAQQVLAGKGEGAELLSQALADFRYDVLAIDILEMNNKTGNIKLLLAGHNPAVLEGYPFKVTITLDISPQSLFDIWRQLVAVPQEILRQQRQRK